MKKILFLLLALVMIPSAFADTQSQTITEKVTDSVITVNAGSSQTFTVPLNIEHVNSIESYIIEIYASSGTVSSTLEINASSCRTWTMQVGSNYIDCTAQMTPTIAAGSVNITYTNNAAATPTRFSARQILTYHATVQNVSVSINSTDLEDIKENVTLEHDITRLNIKSFIQSKEGEKMAIGIWAIIFILSLSSLTIGMFRNNAVTQGRIFEGSIFVWYLIGTALFASTMWYGFALPLDVDANLNTVVGAGNYIAGGLGMLGMLISLVFTLISSVNFINVLRKNNKSL